MPTDGCELQQRIVENYHKKNQLLNGRNYAQLSVSTQIAIAKINAKLGKYAFQYFELVKNQDALAYKAINSVLVAYDLTHTEAMRAFIAARNCSTDDTAPLETVPTDSAQALFMLGLSCLFGLGQEQSRRNAIRCFLLAAHKGHSGAQYQLSQHYIHGKGVFQNVQKAEKWLVRAAKQNHVAAQYNLAFLYEDEQGGRQDSVKAARLYAMAAVQGHKIAQYALACLYYKGEGVEQNHTIALSWFKRSAKQGHINAQYSLASLYKEKKDYINAVKWFRRSARNGDAVSQYFLANLYKEGKGLDQDYKKAAKWYRRAAKQGLDNAQYSLACLYNNGKGVLQDYTKAIKWFEKSAKNGNLRAQYYLGVMHEYGKGFIPNMRKAARHYRTAAENQFKDAVERLKNHQNYYCRYHYAMHQRDQATAMRVLLSTPTLAKELVWEYTAFSGTKCIPYVVMMGLFINPGLFFDISLHKKALNHLYAQIFLCFSKQLLIQYNNPDESIITILIHCLQFMDAKRVKNSLLGLLIPAFIDVWYYLKNHEQYEQYTGLAAQCLETWMYRSIGDKQPAIDVHMIMQTALLLVKAKMGPRYEVTFQHHSTEYVLIFLLLQRTSPELTYDKINERIGVEFIRDCFANNRAADVLNHLSHFVTKHTDPSFQTMRSILETHWVGRDSSDLCCADRVMKALVLQAKQMNAGMASNANGFFACQHEAAKKICFYLDSNNLGELQKFLESQNKDDMQARPSNPSGF